MPELTPKLLTSLAVWSALSCGVFSTAISIASMGYSPARLSDGLTSPGLALEVPKSVEQIYEVVGKLEHKSKDARNSRNAALYSQYLDGPLIVSYLLLFASAGLLQWRTMRWPWKWMGLFAAILTLTAAACDVMEDVGIVCAVKRVTAGMQLVTADAADIARFGWPKWALLFWVLLLMIPLLVNRSDETSLARNSAGLRWIGLACAVWMLSSAIGGILACWYQQRLRLSSAVSGVAALPFFFWPTYALFRDGAAKGLDRVANWPVIRLVKRWPREPAGGDDHEPA